MTSKEVFKMNTYDRDFKNEAVRLALTSDQPICQTACNLGIKEATLYHWISVAKEKNTSMVTDEKGNSTNVIDELNKLRKENARLREEREILKKAATFFAKESK